MKKAFIIIADARSKAFAHKLALNLGNSLEIILGDFTRSFRAQMKQADRQNADFAITLKHAWLVAGKIPVKDMNTGEADELDFTYED